MRQVFFSYNEFGNDAKMWSWWSVLRLSGEWMLGIPEKNGENGFLRQTCRHMLRTSAAERLTDPLPTHGG